METIARNSRTLVTKGRPKSLNEIKEIVSRITYKNWSFRIEEKGDSYFIQAVWEAPCTVTGKIETQKSRKWLVSRWTAKSELVRTVYKVIENAELHEMQENFKYNGVAIFDPHRDVEELTKLSKLDVRDPPQ